MKFKYSFAMYYTLYYFTTWPSTTWHPPKWLNIFVDVVVVVPTVIIKTWNNFNHSRCSNDAPHYVVSYKQMLSFNSI